MNTEASAPGCDVHQRLHELGEFFGHGGEFVDDDEQAGEGLVVGGRQIAGEVLGAHVAEDPLRGAEARPRGM